MEGLEMLNIIAKWAAIAGIGAYAWNISRKVASKDDLERLHDRIDDRVSKSEYEVKVDSLEKSLADLKEAITRYDDHQRAGFREIREILQRREDK